MDAEVIEHALVELPSLLIGSVEVVGVGAREQGAEIVELLDDEVSAGRVAFNV